MPRGVIAAPRSPLWVASGARCPLGDSGQAGALPGPSRHARMAAVDAHQGLSPPAGCPCVGLPAVPRGLSHHPRYADLGSPVVDAPVWGYRHTRGASREVVSGCQPGPCGPVGRPAPEDSSPAVDAPMGGYRRTLVPPAGFLRCPLCHLAEWAGQHAMRSTGSPSAGGAALLAVAAPRYAGAHLSRRGQRQRKAGRCRWRCPSGISHPQQ